MTSKSFILCLVCFSWFSCRAQEVLLFSDARSTALGSSYSLVSGWWSCLSNPAGLASENLTGCGLNYSNYYGMPETATGAFAVSMGVKPGKMGIGFAYSGLSAISESRAVLAYARSLGKKIRAGIGISWLHFSQPDDYRDLYTWIPSMGIQWLPGKKWITGITLMNPAKQEYLPHGYRNLASCIAAGIGYKPSDDILVLFEVQHLSKQPVRYALGFEALLVSSFTMRFAVSRQFHYMYSAGIGYSNDRIFIDTTINHHPVLGFSPCLAFNFKF